MREKFEQQLLDALDKYTDKHVDIYVLDGKKVYATYHSSIDSFPVTDTFSLSELGGMEELKKYEQKFKNLCICEDIEYIG